MTKKLLFIFVFVSFITNMAAQAGRAAEPAQGTIMHVDQFLEWEAGSVAGRAASAETSRAATLVHDLHDAAYVQSGATRVHGEHPVQLFTDMRSIAAIPSISAATLPVSEIEIVSIKINQGDLNPTIDLSVFSNFPNLKYVYIISATSTTAQRIGNMVRNNNSAYSVFYNIIQPN